MTQSLKIHRFSALSISDQASCLQIPDLLNRHLKTSFPVSEDINKSVAVASEGGAAVGWIRFSPRRLLLYRDPKTGLERLLPAALIEFPVTERLEPTRWASLIEHALGNLFQLGASWAGIYLPSECTRHTEFLKTMGFSRYAECDTVAFLQSQGYDRACSVWIRRCTVARGYRRPDIYPYLAQTGILYTADVNTAPDPTADFWSQALIYSGYSGYPWLSNILDTFIDANTSSILSVPCATADVFRLLPASKLQVLEHGMGVDIVDRNISFGKARLSRPYLDIVNMLLCHAFFTHRDGNLSMDIIEFLHRLGDACGRSLSSEEVTEYYLQLQAAFEEMVLGGAITDWFVLLKGFGRFIALSPEPNIFTEPQSGEDGFRYSISLADKMGEGGVTKLIDRLGKADLFNPEYESGKAAQVAYEAGKIRLETHNMFEMDLKEKYSLIFVWEAALMVAGAGQEDLFLDQLCKHLKKKGRIIFTGIRGMAGRWPRELEILKKLLTARGFEVALAGVEPRPAQWTFGHVSKVWFPVLIAQAL